MSEVLVIIETKCRAEPHRDDGVNSVMGRQTDEQMALCGRYMYAFIGGAYNTLTVMMSQLLMPWVMIL